MQKKPCYASGRIGMLRAQAVLFAAVALLTAQIPCLAACAGDLCSEISSASIPPCHRHRQHPDNRGSNCARQGVTTAAIPEQAVHAKSQLASVASAPVTNGPVRPSPVAPEMRGGASALSAASPPGMISLSSVVLRI